MYLAASLTCPWIDCHGRGRRHTGETGETGEVMQARSWTMRNRAITHTHTHTRQIVDPA